MKKYKIGYGLGGSFGGIRHWEKIEAGNEDEAVDIAWQYACEMHESYASRFRSVRQYMEEDGLSEEEAIWEWEEDRERWLCYSVKEIEE